MMFGALFSSCLCFASLGKFGWLSVAVIAVPFIHFALIGLGYLWRSKSTGEFLSAKTRIPIE